MAFYIDNVILEKTSCIDIYGINRRYKTREELRHPNLN